MKFLSFLLILFSAIVLSVCTPKSVPYSYHNSDDKSQLIEVDQEDITEEKPIDLFANFSVDSIQIRLEAFVDSIKNDELFQVKSEYIFSKNVLPEMYKKTTSSSTGMINKIDSKRSNVLKNHGKMD